MAKVQAYPRSVAEIAMTKLAQSKKSGLHGIESE